MNKIQRLKKILKKLGSIVVAFSGGVDSSFLLRVASDTLPKKDILAVTAVSDTYTRSELRQARDFAKRLNVRHKIIRTNELSDINFAKNPRDRCYYCKKELFGRLKGIARENAARFVVDASNLDDKKDYRPGSIAKKEFMVRSPLQEARITKVDIRRYSKRLGLETWNAPSMACLASRIPYGRRIEKTLLKKVERAENVIKRLGIKQVRVRYHEGIARIEVEQKDIKRFLNKRFCDRIKKSLKLIGFTYIVLDLEGYRTGSLNEALR
ncbi:MAG: ATP-dependent sacrificial sulfur transferase LarE [Candidatus Omnitrophota bacterium]